MEHNDMQNMYTDETTPNKNKLGVPVVALLFNIIPYILFLVQPIIIIFFPAIIVFTGFGVLVGIAALRDGKKHIGIRGVVISIIAIAWPLIFIATVFLVMS